jgi:hypothetical protein
MSAPPLTGGRVSLIGSGGGTSRTLRGVERPTAASLAAAQTILPLIPLPLRLPLIRHPLLLHALLHLLVRSIEHLRRRGASLGDESTGFC